MILVSGKWLPVLGSLVELMSVMVFLETHLRPMTRFNVCIATRENFHYGCTAWFSMLRSSSATTSPTDKH